jgi:5'(3')-deoxyribonucleotidase
MARVGIDLDGVVYDFVGAYRKFLGTGDGAIIKPEPVRWEFFKDWGVSEEEFLHDLQHHPEIFTNGEPYPGAIMEVERLALNGHTIVFITDRVIMGEGSYAYARTRDWLLKHEIPFHELHITADKASIDVDYFLDDRPSNVTAMLRKGGVDAFLCNRSWNKDAMTLDDYAYSLKGFVDYVLDHERGLSRLTALLNEPSIFKPAAEVLVTSPTGGSKGKKLARFDLIPAEAMWKVAEVYGMGAEKRGDWNWRKGYDWSLSIGAMERHLNQFKQGESRCAQDGQHHLASVVFHALALMTFEEECPEYDDRFKKGMSNE